MDPCCTKMANSFLVSSDDGMSDKLSETSKTILASLLRPSTAEKYKNYWNQFIKFHELNTNNKNNIKVEHIINFLSHLYNKGATYSTINSAKVAISYFRNIPPYTTLGDHPMIKKFMKGAFNLRPPVRKTSTVWDVKILFDYFLTLPDNKELNFEMLSYKLLLLLLLLGGQRVNTIFWFHVDEMVLTNVSATFSPSHVIKHSKQGRKTDTFEYTAYHNTNLCVIDCLTCYVQERNKRVTNDVKKLFITHRKPHKAVSIDTLRRWVKNTLHKAGIYNFSAHSCRSASTSKAEAIGMSIEEITAKACWKNAQTFYKHYKKDIVVTDVNNFNKILDD